MGGVDNIGAAAGSTPGKPESNARAPSEKFAERKKKRIKRPLKLTIPLL
jgi:hypothetical protein